MSDVQFPRNSARQGLLRQTPALVGPWRVIYLTLAIGAVGTVGAMGITLMQVVARLQSGMSIFG